MKKIDILTRDAFNSNTPVRLSNTEVRTDEHYTKLFLHGNLIACKELESGLIRCNMCGWNTPTTRTRLNAIGANVYTRKGVIYSNGSVIASDCVWFGIN